MIRTQHFVVPCIENLETLNYSFPPASNTPFFSWSDLFCIRCMNKKEKYLRFEEQQLELLNLVSPFLSSTFVCGETMISNNQISAFVSWHGSHYALNAAWLRFFLAKSCCIKPYLDLGNCFMPSSLVKYLMYQIWILILSSVKEIFFFIPIPKKDPTFL